MDDLHSRLFEEETVSRRRRLDPSASVQLATLRAAIFPSCHPIVIIIIPLAFPVAPFAYILASRHTPLYCSPSWYVYPGPASTPTDDSPCRRAAVDGIRGGTCVSVAGPRWLHFKGALAHSSAICCSRPPFDRRRSRSPPASFRVGRPLGVVPVVCQRVHFSALFSMACG